MKHLVVVAGLAMALAACTQDDAKDAVDKAADAVKDLIDSTTDHCLAVETADRCEFDAKCKWDGGACSAR